MSKRVTTIDESSSVALPPEAVDALGVKPGDDLDVQVIGRAVVVRSIKEAERSRDFLESFDTILRRRRKAYENLAEGPQ